MKYSRDLCRNLHHVSNSIKPFVYISQVNGIDTVRIPVSVMPYEDPSAKYQKQLKLRKQSDADITEPADVEAVSEAEAAKDSVGQVSEASATEGRSTQTSDGTAAPPSDNPRKE